MSLYRVRFEKRQRHGLCQCRGAAGGCFSSRRSGTFNRPPAAWALAYRDEYYAESAAPCELAFFARPIHSGVATNQTIVASSIAHLHCSSVMLSNRYKTLGRIVPTIANQEMTCTNFLIA